MLNEVLSFIFTIGGAALIFMMIGRRRLFPPIARDTMIGSAFALLLAGKYVLADDSIVASIFAVSVAGIIGVVAVRHFRMYSDTL